MSWLFTRSCVGCIIVEQPRLILLMLRNSELSDNAAPIPFLIFSVVNKTARVQTVPSSVHMQKAEEASSVLTEAAFQVWDLNLFL